MLARARTGSVAEVAAVEKVTFESFTEGAQESKTPISYVRVSQMIKPSASRADAIKSQSAQFSFSRKRMRRVYTRAATKM